LEFGHPAHLSKKEKEKPPVVPYFGPRFKPLFFSVAVPALYRYLCCRLLNEIFPSLPTPQSYKTPPTAKQQQQQPRGEAGGKEGCTLLYPRPRHAVRKERKKKK